ncbi:MAG: DUF4097 family beta strand repeat-containing protein [candidate division Zixibacteria bacterium]
MSRFIIVLTIVILQAGLSFGKTYEYEYQKIINVEPGLELTINNANGKIILTTNNDYKLKVDAVKKIIADSKDEADLIADHVQISVASVDGHFSIEPQFLRIHDRSPSFWQKILGKSGEPSYGSIDFVISVPTDCNADIYNSSGNIEATGIRGKIFVSGTAGNVIIRDNQGDLEITTTSGLVELNDIEGEVSINANGSDVNFYSINGNVEIRNSSGLMTGEYLIGDLVLSQTTGSIDLKHIEGDIRLQSTSGKINILQDFGALDVSTESGNINIKTELNSAKDYFVETISGSIEFLIPVASGGEIKLEAGSGDINTQVPISIDSFSKTRITGSFGHGGPKVSLITRSGDITLSEF